MDGELAVNIVSCVVEAATGESGAGVRPIDCLLRRRSPLIVFRNANPLFVARASFRNTEYQQLWSGTAGH